MRLRLTILLVIGYISIFSAFSLDKADSLLPVVKNSSHQEKFIALLQLAKHYDLLDSLDLTEFYYQEAIRFAETEKDILPVQIPYRYLGLFYIETWRPEQAVLMLNTGIKYAKMQGDENILMLCKVDLGILYTRKMEFDSAAKVLDEALYLAVKLSDEIAVVSILTSLSQIEEESGDLLEAIQLLNEIIRKCEINNFQPEIAIMYNNLGNIYRLINQDISLGYFKKAESIASALQDLDLISMIYLNMSFTLNQLNRFKESEKVLLLSSGYSKKVGDSIRLAQVYNSLSFINIKLGNCTQAQTFSDSSLAIVNSKSLEYGRFQIKFVQALIEECKGNTSEAIKQLSEIARQLSESGIIAFEQETYQVLYELHTKSKNYEAAFSCLNHSDSLKQVFISDSIVSKAIEIHYQQLIDAQKEITQSTRKLFELEEKNYWYIIIGLSIVLLIFVTLTHVYYKRSNLTPIQEEKYTQNLDELKQIIHEFQREEKDEKLISTSYSIASQLKILFPSLCDLDIQICELLSQKHSTKEISSILNRSMGTIDNHRSLIRKKLNLDDNTPLGDYLQSFVKK